jgi:8-oxo-dGTP pyrophosphatase MutT (NUDIX family)
VDQAVDALTRKIREVLDRRSRQTVERDGLAPAAVLLPLLLRPDGVHILFTKRSEQVPHHKGQISFPGGMVQPSDLTRLDAALREADEEIGLHADAVEVLGTLDDIETVVTRFVITPFVGLIRSPRTYAPDGTEIERVIEIPLSTLLDLKNFRVEYWEQEGRRRPISIFTCEGEIIWGITAAILKQLLDLVFLEPGQ